MGDRDREDRVAPVEPVVQRKHFGALRQNVVAGHALLRGKPQKPRIVAVDGVDRFRSFTARYAPERVGCGVVTVQPLVRSHPQLTGVGIDEQAENHVGAERRGVVLGRKIPFVFARLLVVAHQTAARRPVPDVIFIHDHRFDRLAHAYQTVRYGTELPGRGVEGVIDDLHPSHRVADVHFACGVLHHGIDVLEPVAQARLDRHLPVPLGVVADQSLGRPDPQNVVAVDRKAFDEVVGADHRVRKVDPLHPVPLWLVDRQPEPRSEPQTARTVHLSGEYRDAHVRIAVGFREVEAGERGRARIVAGDAPFGAQPDDVAPVLEDRPDDVVGERMDVFRVVAVACESALVEDHQPLFAAEPHLAADHAHRFDRVVHHLPVPRLFVQRIAERGLFEFAESRLRPDQEHVGIGRRQLHGENQIVERQPDAVHLEVDAGPLARALVQAAYAVERTDEQIVVVGIDRPDDIVRKTAVAGVVTTDAAGRAVEPEQSDAGSHPEQRILLGHRADVLLVDRPRRGVGRKNVLFRHVDVDSLFGPDQQAPVSGRKQAVDPRVAQRLRIVREMLVMADRLAVVTVETVLGAEPHVSGAVLRNGVDIVAAQPVHHGERLHVQRPALVAAAGRSGGRQRQEQKRYPFSRHRISTVYFIQTGAA